jgi:CBS domain containing-hemolysin-like protein
MTATATMIALLVAFAALASTAVASAARAALSGLPRGRTRRLRDAGTRGAAALDRLSQRPSRLAAARGLIAAVGYAGLAAVGTWALERVWTDVPGWLCVAVAAAVTTAIMFSVGEALPRAVALANAEGVGLAAAPWAERVTAIAFPVARLLSVVWTRLVALVSGHAGAEVPWVEASEALRFGASDEENGDHEDDDENMLEAVSGLRAKVVREVMVPRTDMVAIEDTADVEEALRAITAAGVSRVPVFHDTLDDVRGVLYAKDLLAHFGRGTIDVHPADIARPALFVPETKPVGELLREMRSRTHLAIVADEYGGTAGLVTIEDLLEEIVGEIFDEYDPHVPMVVDVGGGRFRVDARLPVDELDERFGTSLDVEADTAGGLFTELAGHIPEAGESIEVEGLRLTVDRMEGNRVRQIIVEAATTHDHEESRDD